MEKDQMTENIFHFNIEEELKKLPGRPGVYIMHDEHDDIIYVGKAISLKNRVRQYFQSSRNKSAKILQMVERIRRFEYIVTDSELEALVLECNLIKEHRPKYKISPMTGAPIFNAISYIRTIFFACISPTEPPITCLLYTSSLEAVRAPVLSALSRSICRELLTFLPMKRNSICLLYTSESLKFLRPNEKNNFSVLTV